MGASTKSRPPGVGEAPGSNPSLLEVYERLLGHYGPQHWWPGDSNLEIVVGAILTQSSAWRNVEFALNALNSRGLLSVVGLRGLPEAELARLIRPAGYFNAKAGKLKAFVQMLDEHYAGQLERLLREPGDALRLRLLATHGIGPETADAIVLYAAGKPTFVVDAYARRIFGRLGLQSLGDSYERWRSFVLDGLPADVVLLNEYHALLVAHGKALCRKRAPLCVGCPLLDVCPSGLGVGPGVPGDGGR